MASKKDPMKPTMAQAYKSANKSSSSKEPVKPKLFGSAAESRAATAVPFKAVYNFFKEGGISGKETPKTKPLPTKETADVIKQKSMADKKVNTARMMKDVSVGSKKATMGPTLPASSTPTKSAAKPYKALKNPEAEKARREFVSQRLEKRGIKVAKKGQPRSAEEKAARAQARATYAKKKKKGM